MTIFSFLFIFIQSQDVTYGSAVQLKGLFTKNRLTVMINQTNAQPLLLASRPPYKDGWYWIIQPTNESQDAIKLPVQCGDEIDLYNSLFSFYIVKHNMKNSDEMGLTKLKNSQGWSTWKIICDAQSSTWKQDEPVQFYNKNGNCFLSSDFSSLPNIESGGHAYIIKCEQEASKYSQWRAAEGIYLDNEPVSEMYAKSPRDL